MWRNVEKQELGALRKVADWWDLEVVWHLGGFQSGPSWKIWPPWTWILKHCLLVSATSWALMVTFIILVHWLISWYPYSTSFWLAILYITALVSKFWGKFIGSISTPKKKHQPKGFLRLKSPFSHEFRKNRLTNRVKHSPSKNPSHWSVDGWETEVWRPTFPDQSRCQNCAGWKSRGLKTREILRFLEGFSRKERETSNFLGMWSMIGFPCFPILDLVWDDWYLSSTESPQFWFSRVECVARAPWLQPGFFSGKFAEKPMRCCWCQILIQNCWSRFLSTNGMMIWWSETDSSIYISFSSFLGELQRQKLWLLPSISPCNSLRNVTEAAVRWSLLVFLSALALRFHLVFRLFSVGMTVWINERNN